MTAGNDPAQGLAPERTSLSWARTGGGTLAYAALVAHAGVSGDHPVLVVASGPLAAGGVALWTFGRGPGRRRSTRVRLAAAVLLLAGAVAVLAALLPR